MYDIYNKKPKINFYVAIARANSTYHSRVFVDNYRAFLSINLLLVKIVGQSYAIQY